ncbi:MAG TPA: hydrogenase maturation protease [Chloroflexota bacterium]|nr:hydrogenase maturation protease [Chloroflexota bacterium]
MTSTPGDGTAARPLLIGVGNAYRHDDGLGPIVVRQVAPMAGGSCTVREVIGEGVALMDVWQGADTVLLVDATRSGAAPGTIFRLDAGAAPLPVRFFHYSTHAFGPAEGIELARVFGALPKCLIVFGIEGADFTAGEGLSSTVALAVPQLVALILSDLRALSSAP